MFEITNNSNDQINTFALGNAFLKQAVELGWIVGKKERETKSFFITEKGREELGSFGIEVAEILKYKPIPEKAAGENIQKTLINQQQMVEENIHHMVVYITSEEERILRKHNISEIELGILTPSQIAFSTNNKITIERASQLISMASLKKLPGIGETMVSKLYLIGIRKPEDLKSTTPEELRDKLEKRIGAPISDHIKADLQKAIDSLNR
ncbi:helix-hairpin-helix domain-containing protein [bacterium]|nr:helix-hairpin-helix domain-containing protein [bacterium]MBU1753541.1 helix-hairpin-helix domain-containing protein [bacterium]